jgi:hypothetical protein
VAQADTAPSGGRAVCGPARGRDAAAWRGGAVSCRWPRLLRLLGAGRVESGVAAMTDRRWQQGNAERRGKAPWRVR